jgi:hypothetical protein
MTGKAMLVAAAMVAAAIGGHGWFNRYEIVPGHQYAVWVLDRLTGTLSLCLSAPSDACRRMPN